MELLCKGAGCGSRWERKIMGAGPSEDPVPVLNARRSHLKQTRQTQAFGSGCPEAGGAGLGGDWVGLESLSADGNVLKLIVVTAAQPRVCSVDAWHVSYVSAEVNVGGNLRQGLWEVFVLSLKVFSKCSVISSLKVRKAKGQEWEGVADAVGKEGD